MASISVDEMRDIVSGMYKGPIWKEKVKHMSDRQVMAIYFSKSDSELRGKHKKKTRNTYEEKYFGIKIIRFEFSKPIKNKFK